MEQFRRKTCDQSYKVIFEYRFRSLFYLLQIYHSTIWEGISIQVTNPVVIKDEALNFLRLLKFIKSVKCRSLINGKSFKERMCWWWSVTSHSALLFPPVQVHLQCSGQNVQSDWNWNKVLLDLSWWFSEEEQDPVPLLTEWLCGGWLSELFCIRVSSCQVHLTVKMLEEDWRGSSPPVLLHSPLNSFTLPGDRTRQAGGLSS